METMVSNGRRPQLLRTNDKGFSRALNTKVAGSPLDLKGHSQHWPSQDVEKQGFPRVRLGVPKSENEGAGTEQYHDNGSSNLASPGRHDWSPDATPDTEDKQLPARLQDSIGDIKCLQKGNDELSLDSASLELVEVLRKLQRENVDLICPIFDALLVWFYKLKHVQHFLLQIRKTDYAVSATLLLDVKPPSALDPPQWLLIVIESSEWRGRWLNELSIRWVDTRWRTAFSALHVGSISPVASLPRVNPERLQDLWSSARRLITSTPIIPVPAPKPSLVHTSAPCKACAPKRRATPSSSTVTGSGSSKKQKKDQKQGKGNGKAEEDDGDPDDSFSDHDGPRAPKPTNGAPDKPLYACHFYKRYPLLHLKCLYHSQAAPRYVKCHLKRSHKQPIHCPTCYKSFKTRADNNRHIVLRNCERSRAYPYADSISEDTEATLDHGLTTKGDGPDKWFEIWDNLFPGVPRPASPFVEPDNYESIVVASVGEHTALAFQRRLQARGRFTGDQLREIMEDYGETFGTETPSPASSSRSNSLPPAGQPVVPPPDGGGGHSHTPVPSLPARQPQAESVTPSHAAQIQRQQQWQQRAQQQRIWQQQHQQEQSRLQQLQDHRHQQYLHQLGLMQQSPSAYLPSNTFSPQAQNFMPPPPSAQHGSWSRFQHATGPPRGIPSRQPSTQATYQNMAGQYGVHVNPDASQQRDDNTTAQSFSPQYVDMAGAFNVPRYFFQENIPENGQFPGSDTRSQQTLAANQAAALENNRHQVMMPDAIWPNLIDLQMNTAPEATVPSEPSSPTAEPAVAEAAAAPVEHDQAESEEEEQGSPHEPIDIANGFHMSGTGGGADDDFWGFGFL